MGFEEVKEEVKDLIQVLKERDNFLITGHENYDSDSLASSIAMGFILQHFGKSFDIYLKEPLRKEHLWVPLQERFVKEIKKPYENFIFVDCTSYTRAGKEIGSIVKDKFKILIDDHETNSYDGDKNFIFTQAVATSEIIFYLLEELNLRTSEIANLVLLGIIDDIAYFMRELDNQQWLRVFGLIMKLINWGADFNFVSQKLTLKSFEDFKKINLTCLQIKNIDNIFYVFIESNDLKANSLARELLRIKEAKVIVIFIQESGGIRISLRSRGNIDVGYLAKEYFNGGGHKNAAGGFLEMDFESARNFVLGKVKEYLNNVN